MKRAFAGSCLMFALAAFALPANAQKISLGLKAGPTIAQFGGSDVTDASSLTRLIGGGFMVVEFGKYIAFQPELLYAQKGTKDDDAENAKLKIDYIELPLLFRMQADGAARFIPHALIGPTIAYRISCEISGERDGVSVALDCDKDQTRLPVKDLDIGVALGGGVDMAVGRMFATLDMRYVFGVIRVDDDSNPSDVYNRAFSVMAGFRVPLGQATRVAIR